MSRRIDEHGLRALFAEIEAPPGLDRWRERIADVDAEHCDPALHDEEPDQAEPATEDTVTNGAVIALPTDRGLRPKRTQKRSVAVAAAAAVVIGLGGVVVTTTLLNETPPADPTMIIDGPDKTITSPPEHSTDESAPPGSQTSSPPASGRDRPDQNTEDKSGQPANGGATGNDTPTTNEPAWGAMVGDPSAANTGVPLGASLGDHYGDLRITTAGQVVADLRVTGTVIVDAPNVTLRRVLVVASYGSPAVRQNAGNLTIENSELTGGSSLTQSASGLVVRRSQLRAQMTITSGAQVFDSFLDTADILIPSGTSSVLLRHNVFGRVTMNDLDAPIRGVTIENGVLTQVDAPTKAGSASIYVLGNRFRGNAPSTGWNSSAPDYRWSDNTYLDSGAPAHQ
jgi:hypothetical protein